MNDTWTLTVLGVRGSLPVAEADFLAYGGHTSCLRLDCGGRTVFLDAGSGLSRRDSCPDTGQPVHLLLSHVHLDHVLGLPGFGGFHRPGQTVHLYGQDRPGLPFRTQLSTLFGPPYWPLGLEDVPARVLTHALVPGESFFLAEDGPEPLTVSTLPGRHPGGTLFYRLEGGGKRVVYALDCEPDGPMLDALADFAQGCDLLIWDAFFPPGQVRPGWGHSTWTQGAALGQRAGVKRVLMTHYAVDCNDTRLRELERQAAADPRCMFAKEGMMIDL